MNKNTPKITVTRNWIRINHTYHPVPKHVREAAQFNACIVSNSLYVNGYKVTKNKGFRKSFFSSLISFINLHS